MAKKSFFFRLRYIVFFSDVIRSFQSEIDLRSLLSNKRSKTDFGKRSEGNKTRKKKRAKMVNFFMCDMKWQTLGEQSKTIKIPQEIKPNAESFEVCPLNDFYKIGNISKIRNLARKIELCFE